MNTELNTNVELLGSIVAGRRDALLHEAAVRRALHEREQNPGSVRRALAGMARATGHLFLSAGDALAGEA